MPKRATSERASSRGRNGFLIRSHHDVELQRAHVDSTRSNLRPRTSRDLPRNRGHRTRSSSRPLSQPREVPSLDRGFRVLRYSSRPGVMRPGGMRPGGMRPRGAELISQKVAVRKIASRARTLSIVLSAKVGRWGMEHTCWAEVREPRPRQDGDDRVSLLRLGQRRKREHLRPVVHPQLPVPRRTDPPGAVPAHRVRSGRRGRARLQESTYLITDHAGCESGFALSRQPAVSRTTRY